VLGQHGTAKTTLIRLLRWLIDPNAADVRSFPPTERDLLVGAQRCRIQAFDNLSGISAELSDALCRLSTGGHMVLRALRTDSDEVVLGATRPTCMTGITEIVTRADLLDRCVFVTPNPITDYVEDKVFWAKVEQLAPSLLGALLDVVVSILRNQDNPVPLTTPWRMADFVRWVSHAEGALGWQEGAFAEAYAVNRQRAVMMVIEADPLASAFVTFMQEQYTATDPETGARQKLSRKKGPWSGTANELHAVLGRLVGGGTTSAPGWPRSPGALGRALPRIIPPLAAIGLKVMTRRTMTERSIELSWTDVPAAKPEPGPGAKFEDISTPKPSSEQKSRTRVKV
jgi:hypothetical protein